MESARAHGWRIQDCFWFTVESDHAPEHADGDPPIPFPPAREIQP
jgi:hypothetical protein